MPNEEFKPTKFEQAAAAVYSVGTGILYTETIFSFTQPLMARFIQSVGNVSDEDSQQLATWATYGILAPGFFILSRTQFSSNRRAILEYNRQQHDQGVAEHAKVNVPLSANFGAAFKSTATGISAWKLFSKIPGTTGKVIGGAYAAVTWGGSFFTQRKFLGLHKEPVTPTSSPDPETGIAGRSTPPSGAGTNQAASGTAAAVTNAGSGEQQPLLTKGMIQ
jgi:hypothetical protein